MKISLKDIINNFILPVGWHTVKIIDITEGISAREEIPYFICRFENSQGFINNWFYNTEENLPIIIKLFKACGIRVVGNTTLDTNNLINKEVEINVKDQKYTNEATGEKKRIKVVVDFIKPNRPVEIPEPPEGIF